MFKLSGWFMVIFWAMLQLLASVTVILYVPILKLFWAFMFCGVLLQV